MKDGATCPLCAGTTSESIFALRSSPILQNKLFEAAAEARATARVDVTYRYCRACHFAFNPDFQGSSVDYTTYYNNQAESPTYRRQQDELAVRSRRTVSSIQRVGSSRSGPETGTSFRG
jgi:hypothetical protein